MLLKKRTTYFIVFIVFLLGFFNNFFKTYDNQYIFNVFMYGNSSLVWGRLNYSSYNGVFSKGLFLGRCVPKTNDYENKFKNTSKEARFKRYQKIMYEEHIPFKSYQVYFSHPGYQVLFYGLLDVFLPFNNSTKVDIFHFLVSFFNALIFTVLLLFICENKYFCALFTAILLLFNYWFLCYGKDLLMVYGIIFLPMIFVWGSLKYKLSHRNKFVLIFVAFLVKLLFTGFEFVLNSFLMPIIPLLWYYFSEKWNIKKLIKEAMFVYSIGLIALFFMIIVMSIQGYFVKNDLCFICNHLYNRFLLRTFNDVNLTSEQMSLFNVLSVYLSKEVFLFKGFSLKAYHIVFSHLISLFFIYFFNNDSYLKKIAILSLVSLFISISWLIILREHSAIHPHIYTIIWYMPYFIFIYVFWAILLNNVFKLIKNKVL